jgi:hypothetical protein
MNVILILNIVLVGLSLLGIGLTVFNLYVAATIRHKRKLLERKMEETK